MAGSARHIRNELASVRGADQLQNLQDPENADFFRAQWRRRAGELLEQPLDCLPCFQGQVFLFQRLAQKWFCFFPEACEGLEGPGASLERGAIQVREKLVKIGNS